MYGEPERSSPRRLRLLNQLSPSLLIHKLVLTRAYVPTTNSRAAGLFLQKKAKIPTLYILATPSFPAQTGEGLPKVP